MNHILLYLKRNVVAILAVLSLTFIISACDKSAKNGALEGMWRVIRVERTDGTVSEPKRCFWSFQLGLAQLDIYIANNVGEYINGTRIYSNFEYDGNKLRLYNPCSPSAHSEDGKSDDVPIRKLSDNVQKEFFNSLLRESGLSVDKSDDEPSDDTFIINSITDSGMMLTKTDGTKLTLIKY